MDEQTTPASKSWWAKILSALRVKKFRSNPAQPQLQWDAFLSYSRKDEAFVNQLQEALQIHSRRYWIDRQDIRYTEEWLRAIYSGIEAANNFVFIITPDSTTSENCAKELGHAIKHNKRLLPVVRRTPDPDTVPVALAELNWIPFLKDEDFHDKFEELNKSIDTDLSYVRAHTRLLTRAIEWDNKGRGRSLLLRGSDLREVSKWLVLARNKKEPQPTPLQLQFIASSRRAAWTRVAAICATIIVLILTVLIAWTLRNQSKSRRLASDAASYLSSDPELSLLLATEAMRASDTAEAEQVFRQALDESKVRVVLHGHSKSVNSAVYSPDGQLVVTASDDGTAQVWEAESWRRIALLKGHSERIRTVAFSPNSQLIVTASDDNTAIIWNAHTGESVSALRGHGENANVTDYPDGGRLTITTEGVNSAAFSPDGKLVVTAGEDKTARVWDARTGAELHRLSGHTKGVSAAAFSPDGSLIVTASRNEGKALVWDTSTWQKVSELPGRTGMWDAEFSPDSKYIVTAFTSIYAGSPNNIAIVWEARSGKMVSELRGHGSGLLSAAFSPNGEFIVTASLDNTARVWRAATGESVFILSGHKGTVNAASFSPNGKLIVTASDDKTARLWDAASGKSIIKLSHHTDKIHSAVFSPNSRYILTASEDKTARVWEPDFSLKTLKQADVYKAVLSPSRKYVVTVNEQGGKATIWDVSAESAITPLQGDTSNIEINDIQFSPDEKYILDRNEDEKTVYVWETSTGKVVSILKGHTDLIWGMQFSPDSKLVATASVDKTARVWDAQTGEQLQVLPDHMGEVNDAVFSPDGKLLVTSSDDKTSRIWEVGSWKQTHILRHQGAAHRAYFSPNSKLLLTISDSNAPGKYIGYLWDAQTGKLIREMHEPEDNITFAVFSPDSTLIVTQSLKDKLRVTEVSTGRSVAELRGYTGKVSGAAFSADGKFLITAASDDEMALVWEARTGLRVAALSAQTPGLSTAVFGPDDESIVTVSVDDEVGVQFHHCDACRPAETLLARACARLTRNMTVDEWNRHLSTENYRQTCSNLPGADNLANRTWYQIFIPRRLEKRPVEINR